MFLTSSASCSCFTPVSDDLTIFTEVCYNVMISACAKNVRWPVAIQVFQVLRRQDTELTAPGVKSAVSEVL